MKMLKLLGTAPKRFFIFLLLLGTSGKSQYKIHEAFEYLKSPEYYETKQSAYRERKPK